MMEMRTYIRIVNKGELRKMAENTVELIKLILENDNPEQAVHTVAAIIFDFLKQHESHQEETVACQQVLYQMNPSYQ